MKKNIFEEDYLRLKNSYEELLKELEGNTVFVTGGTGLIGSNLINMIIKYNESADSCIRVIALVRNINKAKGMFGEENHNIRYVCGTIESIPDIDENIDYIIHGACVTSSKDFVNKPVETIRTSTDGIIAIMEFSKKMNVKSVVYLSTMEIYGTHEKGTRITEDSIGFLNPTSVRSSYPESKKLCECLCASYAKEYNVPVKILRLTQTFGYGVEYNDGRVFAEFARCVIENKDIILHTAGESKRSYLYTSDAVSAILCVLLKGENGNAYHAANESTYCSIVEMAQLVAGISDNRISVRIETDNIDRGYAPTIYMDLDTSKIKSIGWKPSVDLKEMYTRMIECIRE